MTKQGEYAKFGGMIKKLPIIIFLLIFLFLFNNNSSAFWIWTPESNKWTNPQYAVKETPKEQLVFAMMAYEEGEYKEAIKEFKKLIKHYPRSRQAPEAQFFISRCYEKQGKLFVAFEGYQEVINKYPFSERAPEIIEIQYKIGLELLEGGGSKGIFVDTLAGNDYNPIDVLRKVIKNDPYGKNAPSAQYKIALYLLEKRLYQESRDEFETVMNDYPESEWAQAAQYQIAIADATRSSGAQYDQETTQAAVEELKEFTETYPDAEFSEDAKQRILELRDKEAENSFVIAQFYEKQKKYASAKIYYQSIVDEYQDTKWAIRALNSLQNLSGKE